MDELKIKPMKERKNVQSSDLGHPAVKGEMAEVQNEL